MSHKRTTTSPNTQCGFTIVELMIATMVFSTILLTITYGVISFTKSYYKGLNSSTTQNSARSVMDTIAQAIQFSGKPITPTTSTDGTYFCAGGNAYIFNAGVAYTGSNAAATPGVYEYPVGDTCTNVVSYTDGRGRQLIGKNMRVALLTVTPAAGVDRAYSVAIRLLYGSGGPAADPGADLFTTTTGPTAQCKVQAGSQFCAVSALSTTVVRRVSSNGQ